jgi:hypothetical protein
MINFLSATAARCNLPQSRLHRAMNLIAKFITWIRRRSLISAKRSGGGFCGGAKEGLAVVLVVD